MNVPDDDGDLRGWFARLRVAERGAAPGFCAAWNTASRRAVRDGRRAAPSRRRGMAIGAAMALVALCLMTWPHKRAAEPGRVAFDRSLDALAATVDAAFHARCLGDWRSPTDFLLADASHTDTSRPKGQNGSTPWPDASR